MQKAGLPIVTNEECVNKFMRMKTPETLTTEMICAGVDDGSHDACQVSLLRFTSVQSKCQSECV